MVIHTPSIGICQLSVISTYTFSYIIMICMYGFTYHTLSYICFKPSKMLLLNGCFGRVKINIISFSSAYTSISSRCIRFIVLLPTLLLSPFLFFSASHSFKIFCIVIVVSKLRAAGTSSYFAYFCSPPASNVC